jgi:hypothetical protein
MPFVRPRAASPKGGRPQFSIAVTAAGRSDGYRRTIS